jgi:hypothetical protein
MPLRVALEQTKTAQSLDVPFDVVAFAWMATGDHDTIGTFQQSFKHELGIDSTTTHHTDRAHIGCVFDAGCASQISCPV